MDKGTGGYTEFNWDEAVVDFMIDNPEAMDWKKGHIHSHNTMGVFFSGTDMSELNDNAPNHNIYLSLIVNNYMAMKAKIAMIGTGTFQSFTCKDEEGHDWDLRLVEPKTKTIMFSYDCEIIGNVDEVTAPEDFSKRVDQIIEKKKQDIKSFKKEADAAGVKDEHWFGKGEENFLGSGGKLWDDNKHSNVPFKGPLARKEDDDIDCFGAFVLRMGNIVTDDCLEDALDAIEQSDFSIDAILAAIASSYPAYYENFFDGADKYKTPDMYVKVISTIIEKLEEYPEVYGKLEYPSVKHLVGTLEVLKKDFIGDIKPDKKSKKKINGNKQPSHKI